MGIFRELRWLAAVTAATAAVGWGTGIAGARELSTTPVYFTLTKASAPSNLTGQEFGNVACTSAEMCFAGAVAEVHYGSVDHPLMAQWTGKKWVTDKLPVMAPSALVGTYCVSSTDCWAVGATTPTDGDDVGLILNWKGSGWTCYTDVAKLKRGSVLNAVACTPAGTCFAVGGECSVYQDCYASSETSTLNAAGFEMVEQLVAGRWEVVKSSGPAHAYQATLDSVTCASAKFCLATGELVQTPKSRVEGFAEVWNGTRWSARTLPNPAGYSVIVNGVACPNADSCVAVGYEYLAHQQGLTPTYGVVEAWTAHPGAHRPAWTLTRETSPPYQRFNGVSCLTETSTRCIVVGGVEGPERLPPVAAVWNGSKLSYGTAAAVSGQQTELWGVGCRPTVCEAIAIAGTAVRGERAQLSAG